MEEVNEGQRKLAGKSTQANEKTHTPKLDLMNLARKLQGPESRKIQRLLLLSGLNIIR